MSSYLDVEVNHSNRYYLPEELKYDCFNCDCNHTFDAKCRQGKILRKLGDAHFGYRFR